MSLQLIDPVNTMPFFQPNQVLTFGSLNSLAEYLYQQERYSRNKLIGSGIVCGLSFSWVPTGTANAMVNIDEGLAVTSAGYLIVFKQPEPYSHKRRFTRLKDFEPFSEINFTGKGPVYELLTQDDIHADPDAPKSILLDADKTNRVLILLFDIQAINTAKCLDENCDDKGKNYLYTPRPLLVPKNILDEVLNADSTKIFFTEEGSGWKARQQTNFSITYLGVPNLFLNTLKLASINNNDDLQKLFLDGCQANNYVNTVKSKLNSIINAYPLLLKSTLECMVGEVTGLETNPVNLGDIFEGQVTGFPGIVNGSPVSGYSQYLYDYIRDVADCYNDLYSLIADYISECGGNEYCFPYHLMLGIPGTNDTLSCYEEKKFSETNYKYRSYFKPSPLTCLQYNLAQKIEHTLKRLVRVVAFFKIDIGLNIVKVIPGNDYDTDISIRAIPYYYDAAKFEDFFRIWNYDSTRHNKLSNPRGYHATNDEDILLRNDTRKINFYRIEGHIGNPVSTVLNDIETLKNKYNLPFNVIAVPLQNNKVENAVCSFEDLEAEFNYYRDRALGYLREIERWLLAAIDLIDTFIADASNNGTDVKALIELQEELKLICEQIVHIEKILMQTRCLENFDYDELKKSYAAIWNIIFDAYFANFKQGEIKEPNQALNSSLNLLSIIFLRPAYRIWYMYQYRLSIAQNTIAMNLSTLASKYTGLEHLAGVRRGEIFLLVSDQSEEGDVVVADFNLPFFEDCNCMCNPCINKPYVRVSPLQKPVIMVVDRFAKQDENFNSNHDILKLKAYPDEKGNYILELDNMGFYKADTKIEPFIEIKMEDSTASGGAFELLKAEWVDGFAPEEKMRLTFFANNSQEPLSLKLNYTLKGDFPGQVLNGSIYLVVLGSKDFAGGTFTVNTNEAYAYNYYPYKTESVKEAKPQMEFSGLTSTKIIGNSKMKVYTSKAGNQYVINKDADGLPYIDAINVNTPGVDDIPFILKTENSNSAGSVTMNVVDKTDKLTGNVISGIIKDNIGEPIANAKLTTSSGKEIITNDKGEYSLADIKAGDLITVEKQGFKTSNIQVNSKMTPDIQMNTSSLFDISKISKIDPTGKLGNIASSLNKVVFKNFME